MLDVPATGGGCAVDGATAFVPLVEPLACLALVNKKIECESHYSTVTAGINTGL